MKAVSATILAMGLFSGAAIAQQSDGTNKAILDALQGLNSRLDSMQRDIDGLKGQRGQGGAPSAASSPASSAPPPQAPTQRARGELRPGWVVAVYNNPKYDNTNYDGDAIGLFIHQNSRFSLQSHQKNLPANNNVAYKADGFIRISTPGRYGFYVRHSGNRGTYCSHALYIDQQKIFDDAHDLRPGSLKQGSVDLAGGDYRISFRLSCAITAEQYTSRTVLIRGPDDMAPRELGPNEILHIARGNQRSSNEAAPAEVMPPHAGMIRTVRSEVNVRQEPTTASGVAAKLSPGMSIRVAGLTSDQQWARIQVNGRDVGFIRVSALNLNTQ